MDATHFDRLTRTIPALLSRRGILRGIGSAALGLGLARVPGTATAKNKKLKRNGYGCVDVGNACRGNDANCCSGICQGKKPKRGEKDKSVCVAHNARTCTNGQDSCLQGNITCGTMGICLQTTGKAEYCGKAGACAVCTKDADCEATKGPGAACAICAASCAGTGGTACYAAAT
jgi:hypothetical protein